jgi:hypothetical protein
VSQPLGAGPWTDAFGVVLLLSLWEELHDDRLLRECEWVVAEVDRVLGRARGIRIGEAPDRDGRVRRLNAFFDVHRSGDEYDTNAITHVMACTSHFPGRFLASIGAKG